MGKQDIRTELPAQALNGESPRWSAGRQRPYRVDMAASTKCSNGLAWSPDGRTTYQSDTAISTIFAAVERGAEGHGPDGAAVG